jgi:UDP-N-acetylglucosamine:LPS N-acetylglucosamine transferase
MESFLFNDLSALLSNPERRAEMGRCARTLARPDAVREIAGMAAGLAQTS